MEVAFIAHDTKKELMVQFCIAYCGILCKHNLIASSTTAKYITDATGLTVEGLISGDEGGEEQIAQRVSYNEIDLLIDFRDTRPENENFRFYELLRLCDLYSVPVATNIGTAEALIRSLERGDLDWRKLVNPRSAG